MNEESRQKLTSLIAACEANQGDSGYEVSWGWIAGQLRAILTVPTQEPEEPVWLLRPAGLGAWWVAYYYNGKWTFAGDAPDQIEHEEELEDYAPVPSYRYSRAVLPGLPSEPPDGVAEVGAPDGETRLIAELAGEKQP